MRRRASCAAGVVVAAVAWCCSDSLRSVVVQASEERRCCCCCCSVLFRLAPVRCRPGFPRVGSLWPRVSIGSISVGDISAAEVSLLAHGRGRCEASVHAVARAVVTLCRQCRRRCSARRSAPSSSVLPRVGSPQLRVSIGSISVGDEARGVSLFGYIDGGVAGL